ncbi:protoheme IX farnesyltransferase [Carboxylicivirga sp. RSCT41]|uniref:protoheme IX farnesyltransferase n=1 Tax=Carboxylicivirga agarovorans TaxID=3417570 RepID=UPI003D354F80
MKKAFKNIAIFGKFSISLPIALSCFIAFVLFNEQLSWEGVLAATGIFFMSAGASALNQFQEQNRDKLMRRTQDRPLPRGIFSKKKALLTISCFCITGTTILSTFNLSAVIWGWAGIIWYNLIYTPLKTKTAFSVFPGAVVGAIPPIAGWCAAGGSIVDFRIHFIAFFFFLGQMPHFWLLVLKYKNQYKNAGFPVITDHLSNSQVVRINLIWFIATFISALFLPILDIITKEATSWIAFLASIIMIIWVVKSTMETIQARSPQLLRKQFIYFNSFYLLIMLLVIADKI